MSPENDHGLLLGNELAAKRRNSITPSIFITPAKENAPWKETEDQSLSQRRRAASSIYSQAPGNNNYNMFMTSPSIPPIPPIPPDSKRKNLRIQTGRDIPPRITSTCTVFDDSPITPQTGRPGFQHPQLHILKRSSTDTLATRPRSEGWWNHIISPFWPRSPMTFKSPSTEKLASPPFPLKSPSLLGNTPKNRERNDSLGSGHTSWTDSPVEEEPEKPALMFDRTPEVHRSMAVSRSELDFPQSPQVQPASNANGTAQEYFEASMHDMYNSKPYFECQNHVCLPPTRVFEANGLHPDDQSDLASRDIHSVDRCAPSTGGKPNAAQAQNTLQVPGNPFSAAFHEAIGPKTPDRPTSEAPDIEDLDATPDVQEAYIAPIVKAPEPEPVSNAPAPISRGPPAAKFAPQETPILPAPREVDQPRASPAKSAATSSRAEIETPKRYRTPPPPPTTDRDRTSVKEAKPQKRYIAVMPPEPPPHDYAISEPPVTRSPGPLTPKPQRASPCLAGRAYDSPNINSTTTSRKTSLSYKHNHYNSPFRSEKTVADLHPPPRNFAEYYPKEKANIEKSRPPQVQKSGLNWGSCWKQRRSNGKQQEKMSKKKRRLVILIGVALLSIVILALILALTLTKKGDKMPVESRWLNLTNYPPMPTGISTIAQPNAVREVSGCISPQTMWSCALPKEEQMNIAPNMPNQPNFRVEIRFQNGTNATNSSSANVSNKRSEVENAVSTTNFVRSRFLRIRRSFSSNLYNTTPASPIREDQIFLGNTTDGNSAPFDGESTPFFMTFYSPNPLPSRSRSVKRDDVNSTDPFPNLSSAIPNASTNPDGTASPANLYPYPSAQPLRLYNRGQDTEHYGFYTYFDRSIFLKSATPPNDTSSFSDGSSSGSDSTISDDANGGALETAAKVRCTWSQTRFLVQLWTRRGNALLQGNSTVSSTNHTSSSHDDDNNNDDHNHQSLTNSSANDFSRPGSFPYPVTFTLDRHGGDIRSKQVYCYPLDANERPLKGQGTIQLEDRTYKDGSDGIGAGGRGGLVNPARGPWGNVKVDVDDGGPGGIDGGSGGCGCVWQNWA